ncbi:hypothetical protein [Streptomyces sp. RTd22]|uniref:hypothetical protein n=1 Tax=Streptomyces sp. RTd22 TaxID=1841249 RepID=UPI00131A7295|nr:hypothetical protein [Streptomyces sp. RTd22]
MPSDIERPAKAGEGDFCSESTGKHYDLKGLHSNWPPFNDVRDKSLPFKEAYDKSAKVRRKFAATLEDQIVNRGRVAIVDTRNASQSAIDDVKALVKERGWENDVIWYP